MKKELEKIKEIYDDMDIFPYESYTLMCVVDCDYDMDKHSKLITKNE